MWLGVEEGKLAARTREATENQGQWERKVVQSVGANAGILVNTRQVEL